MGIFNWIKKIHQEPNLKNVPDQQKIPQTVLPSPSNSQQTTGEQSDTVLDIQPLSTSIDDLNVGQILLIDWCNHRLTDDFLPGYFNTSYGINPITERAKLIKEEYIVIGKPHDALPALKVPQLKEILRNNNLKLSGKKHELVVRISTKLNESEYQSQVPSVYIATDKGKQILAKCGILPWMHKHQNIYGLAPNDLVSVIPCLENSEEAYLSTIIPLQTQEIRNRISQHQINFASSMVLSRYKARLNHGDLIEEWLPDFLYFLAVNYCQIGFYNDFSASYSLYNIDGTGNSISWIQAQAQELFQNNNVNERVVIDAISSLDSTLKQSLPYKLNAIWSAMPQVLNSLVFDSSKDAEAKQIHFIKTHAPKSAYTTYQL